MSVIGTRPLLAKAWSLSSPGTLVMILLPGLKPSALLYSSGRIGTPALVTVWRALILSPISRMFSGVGPMKVMPQLPQISANSAFSERNP